MATTSNKEFQIDVAESRSKMAQSLVSSLDKELAALPDELSTVCIYKVSEKYMKLKEESYTPRLVSIGPFHHGKSHLQAMEAYKLKCLKMFMRKFKVTLKYLIDYAISMEGPVRACYEDTLKFKSEEFSKMILQDGIFMLHLFIDDLLQITHDDMLVKNRWMASDIMHDMLLLENQLPLIFIQGLYEMLNDNEIFLRKDHFDKCLVKYFEGVGNTKRLQHLTPSCELSRHLVEFLFILHGPSDTNQELARSAIELHQAPRRFVYNRSVSELQEAGVRFHHGMMGTLFEVSFEDGLLILPQLTVNDKTETFFRNLIAFEQCGHYEKNITSYIIFMDSLINTAEDVELLVKHRIIDNMLGENQLVGDLFNTLHKEVIEDQKDFYFAEICKDLDEYSKNYFHRWKSAWFKWKLILKNRYFSNPWSVVSVIAAFLVILFTIAQTVLAILQLKKG